MFRDFDESTIHDSSSVISRSDRRTKDHYKKNKLSGKYVETDPITGEVIEEGEFFNGVETGLWKVIDQDGDQQHFRYRQERIGALCRDGSLSSATGSGACSWHGGVAQWLMENKRYPVGGTGKYQPIQQRVQKAKLKLRQQMGLNVNRENNQLLCQVINKLLAMDKNEKDRKQKQQEEKQKSDNKNDKKDLEQKIQSMKETYEEKINKLEQRVSQLQTSNSNFLADKKKLQNKLAEKEKQPQKGTSLDKEKLIEEKMNKFKAQEQKKLHLKDKQIQQLNRQLSEANQRERKLQENLKQANDRSIRSENNKSTALKKEQENEKIKMKLKLLEEQLRQLNQTVYGKQQSSSNQDGDSYLQKSFSSSRSGKSSSRRQRKSQKPQNRQRKQPQVKKSNQKHEEVSSIGSRPSHSQQSQSYSKILKSKLFMGLNNKTDLSYRESREKDNSFFLKKQNGRLNVTQISKNETKRKYQFRFDDESDEENKKKKTVQQQSDEGQQLRSDSQDDSQQKQNNPNGDVLNQNEDNCQIFKSIPFKTQDISVIQPSPLDLL